MLANRPRSEKEAARKLDRMGSMAVAVGPSFVKKSVGTQLERSIDVLGLFMTEHERPGIPYLREDSLGNSSP